jgi:hypothetical protein
MTTTITTSSETNDARIIDPVEVDRQLMIEAELYNNGANIHNVKSQLAGLKMAIEAIEAGLDVDGTLRKNLRLYQNDLRRAIIAGRRASRPR